MSVAGAVRKKSASNHDSVVFKPIEAGGFTGDCEDGAVVYGGGAGATEPLGGDGAAMADPLGLILKRRNLSPRHQGTKDD